MKTGKDLGERQAEKLLTRPEIAVLLGVNAHTICKWERDGFPIAKRGRRGVASMYRESDGRAWLQAREDAARTAKPIDVAQERARKERAQAELTEQTFQTRAKNLLPRDEVEAAWGAEQKAVRTKLLALPTAYADRVHRAAVLDGVDGVEDALKEAVYDVLRELADGRPRPDGGDGEEQAA